MAARLPIATIGLWCLLALAQVAYAAELKVLCAAPVEEAMRELAPQFERASGHRLIIQYDVAPVLKRRIDSGEAFDAAILLPPLVEDLIKRDKMVLGSSVVVARSGLGVGVREGAALPDIATPDTFRVALRSASSIAYSKEGASGVAFLRLIERLGIAEEIRPKLKPTPAEMFPYVVPRREAEMIVVPISSILVPGMRLVGPVPEELQTYFLFTAGISTESKEGEAAKALVAFLTAPAAHAVFKARGLEPGSR